MSRLDISAFPREEGEPTQSRVFRASFEYRETFKKSFLDHENYSPPEGLSRNSNGYNVSLGALESLDRECTIYVGAQSSLYSRQDTEVILKTYVHLLETFTERPASRVDRPSLFPKADIARGIELGSGSSLSSTWPETFLNRIDEMVATNGTSTAIKDSSGKLLTYTQMDLRVQSISASLKQIEGVDFSCVGIFQQPSVDWVCSMLAIMRVGAVCVPLDCRNGLPRLAGIVKACRPTAVLADSTTSDDAKYLDLEKAIMINISLLQTADSFRIPISAKPEATAVILFTSGTTGVPKGIMLKHSSIRNSIETLTQKYNIGKEIVLQQTAFSFDMSIDEIFVALCNGGTLLVVDSARRGDSQAIMKIIASEGITYTRATPPEYLSWIRHGADQVAGNRTWKHAFAGGDRMTDSLRQGFRLLGLPDLKLYNSYGPTEITLSAIKVQLEYQNATSSDEQIPMGTPMPRYSIYILDSNMSLVAPGVPGEIVIGGAGVSLGYLNNETLSAEKFLDNPWASPEFTKNGWTKMYRTGNRGRVTLDRQVLFHGRIEGDLQVKLRGIRIELEDIENSILQASKGSFTDVVCAVRGDPEFVVAHATFSPSFVGSSDGRSQFIQKLLAHLPLPSYMVPATIIPLENMPLTVHLKRDRAAIAALPVSQSSALDSEASDLNAMELELKAIWVELLPSEMSNGLTTRDADFFRFGGSSLLMVELQSLVRMRFGVSVSLQEMFQVSALGAMAERIQERMGNT